ncbi:hypothetical protein D0837_17235 [Bordetella avium]|uniref:hypothetical protein n=1 Tax=Bordetella avium TaxID=521 RepID=UPI000FF3AF70|nr:hypothetical protein [Bordetella avium]RIQ79055.1 hypothetical protein D0837_17235 [Bordetella avium]
MEDKDRTQLIALIQQTQQLHAQNLVTATALQVVFRALPTQSKPLVAGLLREFGEDLLAQQDDQPTGEIFRAALTLQLAAYLEALDQPPGRPAGQ